MTPAYLLSDLVMACEKGTAFVTRGARATAAADFGLLTEAAILAFIAAGGIEAPTYINTKGWENNPDPNTVVHVDAYRFHSGSTCGYLAFGLMPATGKLNHE
jgi:tRNA A37 threonylcarbamoyladenosine biosynthesis protein TsaE